MCPASAVRKRTMVKTTETAVPRVRIKCCTQIGHERNYSKHVPGICCLQRRHNTKTVVLVYKTLK